MLDNEAIKIRKKREQQKRILGYILALSLAVGTFISGLYLGQGSVGYGQAASIFTIFAAEPEKTKSEPNLDEFWKVWDLLDEKFAKGSTTAELSEEEKIQGAIDGLVDAYGDPYTIYLPPSEAEEFSANMSGNFSGVGMEVGMRDNYITVIAPLPDTPAERAGILAGDLVVKIDGLTTEDMNVDEAVNLIRGEKGTVVELQIYREGESEFLDIPITRDTINIPTVKTEVVEGVFLVSLYSFNGVAEAQMRDALKEYLESGLGKLVIDVRGNPGGYLQGAVSIAGYFLPSGKVVVKESFGESDKDEVFRTRGKQIQLFNKENLVVLVDGGSASASEILAGALKDHEVATIIGAQTFGKGSVQELVELESGSSLKVTVARWLTPNGTSISEGGLTPDIVISRTVENRAEGVDPQKEAAIKYLNGEDVISEVDESLRNETGE